MTSAARPAALVLKLRPNPFHHGCLGIVRSLGRAGVRVYATVEDASSPLGRSRYLSGRFLWTPDLDDPRSVLEGLADVGDRIGGRPVVIPTDDVGAILVAEHADELRAHVRLPDQPPGLPRRLAAKDQLAEICRTLGLPAPDSRRFPSLRELAAVGDRLRYPAVVKLAAPWEVPVGSVQSTTIVRDADQLRALARAADPGPAVLLQEYLPAQDCEDWFFHACVGETAPGGAAAFRLSVTGRKLRAHPPTAGLTTFGRAWDNPELRSTAEAFLSGVGYRGIVDLDYRLDRRTGRFHLLDANPRAGAQFAIARRDDGRDAAHALYRELTAQPLPAQVSQSSEHGLCVENYDLVSGARLLLAGQLSPLGWWRSMRAGPVEYAWFALDDPLPWLVMWCRFAGRVVSRRLPRRRSRHPVPVFRDGPVRHRRRRSRSVTPAEVASGAPGQADGPEPLPHGRNVARCREEPGGRATAPCGLD